MKEKNWCADMRRKLKDGPKMKGQENIKVSSVEIPEVNRTMHTSIKFMVILAQCFALLPVNGVGSSRATNLKFTWRSSKMLYTGLLFSGTLFIVFMGFYHMLLEGLRFDSIVEHVFYASGLCTVVLFVRLAQDWPKLMLEWTRVDVAMDKNYGYPNNLDRRLKVTAAIVMLLATAEHLLSLAFRMVQCSNNNPEGLNGTKYYVHVFPQIFHHVPFSIGVAALVQAVSFLSTFTWTYNNLFIILVSSALALRFKQIHLRLKQDENKIQDPGYWIEIREDYDRLCNLCKLLDNSLSLIVLLSFATNLFFILVQLFYSLRLITDPVEKVYFFYSFGFLIIRTVAVSLYAAWINDESKEPATVLNSVPSDVYNNEIRRLLMQISFDNVALTGNRMFKVTRGLILNVAGAIVTYELVLIQFNENMLRPSPTNR